MYVFMHMFFINIYSITQLKSYYKKYENTYKKKINKTWSLIFNKTCIRENLWPTFTNLLNNKQLENDKSYMINALYTSE